MLTRAAKPSEQARKMRPVLRERRVYGGIKEIERHRVRRFGPGVAWPTRFVRHGKTEASCAASADRGNIGHRW